MRLSLGWQAHLTESDDTKNSQGRWQTSTNGNVSFRKTPRCGGFGSFPDFRWAHLESGNESDKMATLY